MNITNIAFPDSSTVIISFTDGTLTTYKIPSTNPQPIPVEVDIKESDGTVETFDQKVESAPIV